MNQSPLYLLSCPLSCPQNIPATPLSYPTVQISKLHVSVFPLIRACHFLSHRACTLTPRSPQASRSKDVPRDLTLYRYIVWYFCHLSPIKNPTWPYRYASWYLQIFIACYPLLPLVTVCYRLHRLHRLLPLSSCNIPPFPILMWHDL